ncbi:hypothetical protein SBA3_3000005 [Candidatus Sulfopaludibacter sp. SbA3]|nr:hypothetical protein SBA3_3000005 [Candidatus Sulfopaludibacter sp. SbA3]
MQEQLKPFEVPQTLNFKLVQTY